MTTMTESHSSDMTEGISLAEIREVKDQAAGSMVVAADLRCHSCLSPAWGPPCNLLQRVPGPPSLPHCLQPARTGLDKLKQSM